MDPERKTSHSELMREVQRLNKEVDHFIDLMMGYHSFTAKIHKANYPYVKMTVPVYLQEALDLVGGEIVDVKIKVVKRPYQYIPIKNSRGG